IFLLVVTMIFELFSSNSAYIGDTLYARVVSVVASIVIIGLISFGVYYRHRICLLVALVAHGISISCLALLFVGTAPLLYLTYYMTEHPEWLTKHNITLEVEHKPTEQDFATLGWMYLHMAVMIFAGSYLFKVMLSFRKYLGEIENQPAPILYSARTEDRRRSAPPPYRSRD
ncbi:hypothetical protein PFISCL1PPCAC_4918, partial [Pristionchus fissidentatus]